MSDLNFVTPLSAMPPGSTIDTDAELSREELAEINDRCDELERHRAQAWVSGQNYIVAASSAASTEDGQT